MTSIGIGSSDKGCLTEQASRSQSRNKRMTSSGLILCTNANFACIPVSASETYHRAQTMLGIEAYPSTKCGIPSTSGRSFLNRSGPLFGLINECHLEAVSSAGQSVASHRRLRPAINCLPMSNFRGNNILD